MKKMKKIAALILAMVMMLALAVPAFAAETQPTISVGDTDTHTYNVYQIFTGNLSGDTLSNIVWGQNGTGYEANKVTPVEQGVLDALTAVTNNQNDVAQLNVIMNYVNISSAPYRTITNEEEISVPAGYYLFVDATTPLDKGDAYNLNVVKIVKDVTVEIKRDGVTSEKKVQDVNDSAANSLTDWQDSADYDIGDSIPFKLTGTIPSNYNNYTTYYYAFHDKEEVGLTFNGDVKVYAVNGEVETDITSSFTVITEGLTDGCTFEVVCTDLKKVAAVTAGTEIVVKYTSTLNDSAVIGSAGNPNKMYLEYSNNPNVEGKGKTPEDKVVVFTYKLDVDKVTYKDNVKEALAGAGFTLYKKNAAGEYVAIGGEVKLDKDGKLLTTFGWEGLDDGDYKLVETTTPAGYNTIEPIYFTISATHSVEADEPKLLTLTGGDIIKGEVVKIDEKTSEPTGTLLGEVVNNAGVVLPETGGIGTTVFYAIGGILVLAAVVLLVTKKRMRA